MAYFSELKKHKFGKGQQSLRTNDFLYETFISSNFGVFNSFENLRIKHSHESTDEGLNKVKLTISNTNAVVLAMNVRQNDDSTS